MPVCGHCGKEWTWKRTFKAWRKAWFQLHCPYCDEKQYETKSSRLKTHSIGFLPILSLFLFSFTGLPWYFFIIWAVVSLAVSFSIMPYFMKVSSKEEFYF